ncbi:MAG: universal stress protein, partial [Actinomycetota bacterium]|nr:universal stress protein [Actinomycetota bacterium]
THGPGPASHPPLRWSSGWTAAKWAAQEAARRNAPLRIVYAVHAPRRRGAAHETHPELPHIRRVTAQAYTVAKHTEPGVRASTEIRPGDAATVLVTAAGEGQLVVLGKSTTGAVDEWVRAPVAVRVSARSLRPVVLVPRPRGAVDTGRPVAAVLGFGDPEDDVRVAGFAAEAAQRAGAALAVVQTRHPRSWPSDSWTEHESEWQQRFPGLEVRRTELPSATAGQVLSSTCPAPLIVLSAGHGSLMHRELDGPHRWLLRHCTSPMALVPPVHRPELEPCEEIIAVG